MAKGMVALTDELRVLDVLEDRLVASFYGTKRLAATGRAWLSMPRIAVASSGVLSATVAVLVLVSSGAAPSAAVAAFLRAARASQRAQRQARSVNESWYARVVETQRLPLFTGQINSLSGPKVGIELHSLRQVWLSATGAEIEQSSTSSSLTNSRGSRSDRSLLPHPTTTKSTIGAEERLASPLAPTIPLFTYHELQELPASAHGLSNTLALVVRKMNQPQAGDRSTTSHGQSSTESKLNLVVTCCSASHGHTTTGQLTAITWLLAMPITPRVRAELYHLAATLPDVHYIGIVRDALGRRGTEIAVGSNGAQFALVFESGTGALLETKVTFGAQAEAQGFGALTQTLSTHEVEQKRRF